MKAANVFVADRITRSKECLIIINIIITAVIINIINIIVIIAVLE